MIRILVEVFKRYSFAQKRVILIVLTGVVGSALGLRLFIFGDIGEIKKNKRLVSEAVKRKTALSRAEAALAQMRSRRDLLAASRNPDWMMRAVYKAAAESGLSVTSISPQNLEKSQDFEKISLIVEAEGGYHQVGKFMEFIENQKPWIFLSQLRLEKLPGAGRQLKFTSVLSAYHETASP